MSKIERAGGEDVRKEEEFRVEGRGKTKERKPWGGGRKRKGYGDREIARQSEDGMGKAIRTWAIAGYYRDVRDVSSIILIAEITVASTGVPPSRPRSRPPRL